MEMIAKDNWEEYPNYYKQIILDPNNNNGSGVLIQKVRIKPKTIAKIHYHKKQTEIFIITKNKGYFIVDNQKLELKEGDNLKVLPNQKHTVGNDSQNIFEFIAFKLKYQKEDTYTD